MLRVKKRKFLDELNIIAPHKSEMVGPLKMEDHHYNVFNTITCHF